MSGTETRLLEAVKLGLRAEHADWAQPVSGEEWQALFELARQQHLLPLVMEAVWPCPAFCSLPGELTRAVKGEVRRQIMVQAMSTQILLALYAEMTGAGLHPLVMKGAACRSTYPIPDARPSSDEDILVPEGEFSAAITLLDKRGCKRLRETDSARDFEVSFVTPEGLHIELHRCPFDPDSPALKKANTFFDRAWERAMPLEGFAVMSPHDHMLYLILHAFKHLINRGFGIRQVCDILLWAKKYEGAIDWPRLKEQCDTLRAWGFAQAVFQIGRDRLECCVPAFVASAPELGEALLNDLLSGGVFGGEEMSRKHSGTVTLGAVESDRSGKKASLLSSLFPSRRAMEKKFPYVSRCPALLPVAWIQRILCYGLRTRDAADRTADSLRIARERTQLLRKLDIID